MIRYRWKPFWALHNGQSFNIGKKAYIKTWFCIARPSWNTAFIWMNPFRKVQTNVPVPRKVKPFVGDCNYQPEATNTHQTGPSA